MMSYLNRKFQNGFSCILSKSDGDYGYYWDPCSFCEKIIWMKSGIKKKIYIITYKYTLYMFGQELRFIKY